MKLIKLSDIENSEEFWRGTKIRLVNNGIDMHPDDRYFDYLLVNMPWDRDFMVLVNITNDSLKLGTTYATKVPVDRTSNKLIVTKNGLREALGQDFNYCFIIKS